MSYFFTFFRRLVSLTAFVGAAFLQASAHTPLEIFEQRLAHFKGDPSREEMQTLSAFAKDLLMEHMNETDALFGAHEEGIVSYECALYDAQDQELADLIGQKPRKIRLIYKKACLDEKESGASSHTPHPRGSCALCAVTRELVWQEHKSLLQILVSRHFGRFIWDELDHFDAMDDVPYALLQHFKNLTNAQKTDFLAAPYDIQVAFAYLEETSGGNHKRKKQVKSTFEGARTRLGTFFEGRKATLMSEPAYAPFTHAWSRLEACERTVDLVGDFYAAVEKHVAFDTSLSLSLLEWWDGASHAPFLHTKGCPDIQPAALEDAQEASPSEPGPQSASLEILRLMDRVMKDAFILARMGFKKTPLSVALEESSGDASPNHPLHEGP